MAPDLAHDDRLEIVDDDVDNATSVSVVIPTAGRPSVRRAVESALGQTHAPIEVLVATAAVLDDELKSFIDETPEVQLLTAPANTPGGGLRDLATRAAAGSWIGYLDDDDVWTPTKLADQLAASDGKWLISSRCEVTQSIGEAAGVVCPPISFDPLDGDVGDWLFRDRRLSGARNILHTSTLLVRADVARTVGWTVDLPRHQDWDFILRAFNEFPADETVQVDHVHALIETGSATSVSAGRDWQASRDWMIQCGELLSDEAAADFLTAQVGRYALMAREPKAAAGLLREAWSIGRPSARAYLIFLSGVAPRRSFEKLMAFGRNGLKLVTSRSRTK